MLSSQVENPTPQNPSQLRPSHPRHQSPMAADAASPRDAIIAAASRVSSQPVWGVLTAVSSNACKRPQGIHLLLTDDEHCIGRVVDDSKFRIDSSAISGLHCKILKKKACNEDTESSYGAFLIDSSTNGTYINWKRLRRGSSKVEAELRHGDIVSFATPPQHEESFAFVYREVQSSVSMADSTVLKRKTEELDSQNKRLKCIDNGVPEGPVSPDEFRSLWHSNMELRKQLDEHVCTIDSLRNENREILERHEKEMNILKESISESYPDQLSELTELLEATKKELIEAIKASVEAKNANKDLKEKLCAAKEIIASQKTSLAKLQRQLDEERDERREEKEKAAAELNAAVEKFQSKAREEVNLLSDAASKRERAQQELIRKLQKSESESSSLVDSLRPKLDEARRKLVISESKVCQLEAKLCKECEASDQRKKRIDEVEIEISQMRTELDKEKKEALAKVSVLEMKLNEIVRDLEAKKQRMKSAKERIMLRETRLHSFYSSTEEIKMLCVKQQEQFVEMQRILKDEDYDHVSHDIPR